MGIPERTHKRCTCCQGWLPLEQFRVNPKADPWGHSLGRGSWCRDCHLAAMQDWRERNRDDFNARRRAQYRAEHPLPTRPCVVCGEPFTGRRDALVCGERCRNRRRRELKRQRAKAA
jgi:hypothetical protein